MDSAFLDITIIISISACIAIVFQLIRQPSILAYILAGIIIGPLGLVHVSSQEMLETLSQIGITLLLFMLGLELRVSELRSVGKVAVITGIGQIVFTSLVGMFLSMALGFSMIASVYISIGLTFSSTIIIVKLLSDKKDLNSLYGKISIGFLLVQDFVAIIALVVLSGLQDSQSTIAVIPILLNILKALLLFGVVVLLSKSVFPRIVELFSHSRELLYVSSLAWALGFAAIVSSDYVGFSIEIGGFLAGLALANSIESFHIVTKVRALRDFFITIFFVLLGMGLSFSNLADVLLPAILMSLFVLIGNPVIVMIILGLLGYRKRTSFMAGLTVAQISEFSLIIIFLGNQLGHFGEQVISIMTIVAMITFTLSTYAIIHSRKLYKILEPLLGIFERKKLTENQTNETDVTNHTVIVGAHRLGMNMIEMLDNGENSSIVIVDFDPDRTKELSKQGFTVVFGDIADDEVRDRANIESAKLIVTTVPDIEDNIILIRNARRDNSDVQIIAMAQYDTDIQDLYLAGANYVIMPYGLVGRILGKVIKDQSFELLKHHKSPLQLNEK